MNADMQNAKNVSKEQQYFLSFITTYRLPFNMQTNNSGSTDNLSR